MEQVVNGDQGTESPRSLKAKEAEARAKLALVRHLLRGKSFLRH